MAQCNRQWSYRMFWDVDMWVSLQGQSSKSPGGAALLSDWRGLGVLCTYYYFSSMIYPPFYCDIKLNFSKCARVLGYSHSTRKKTMMYISEDWWKSAICCECWSYKRNKRQSSHHRSLLNIFRLCASDVIALARAKKNVMLRKTLASHCLEKLCVPKIALQEQGNP